MTDNQDPALQRRRLRITLRDIRQQSRLTQKEVAAALDWSPSKLIRIEQGRVAISRSDLIALLAHYGIQDQDRVNDLLAMAQVAKRQTYANYRDVHDQSFLLFLESEGAAQLIRTFQPSFLPGLLQSEEYADSLIRVFRPELDEAKRNKLVQLRLERQELLTRANPPEFYTVVDEAVVRRRVGKGKVMIRQLERIREVAQLPNVHVQVLPFSAGVRSGTSEGFAVLDFADPADDDLLYIEGRNLLLRENPEDLELYNSIFFDLQDAASPEDRLSEVLDRLIDQMESGGDLWSGANNA